MSNLSARRALTAALLLAGLTAGPCLAQDLGVAAEVWPSSAAAGANAPEREECLFLRAGRKARDGKVCSEDGGLAMRPSFGVAFSGGGTRSASATLGQLRALHELGLDWRLRYVSAVSGGSWAAVPYVFLPPRFDDAAFLGPYLPPEALDGRVARLVEIG